MIKAPPTKLFAPELPFTSGGAVVQGLTLGGFWSWGYSTLLANKARGVLAEFIAAQALGIADGSHEPWGTYDLISPRGTQIEVKSTAYLQAWDQLEHSKPIWGNLHARHVEVADDGSWSHAGAKSAKGDVFVFALFGAKDHETADPLNLDQWSFWVVPAAELAAGSISLGTVEAKYPRQSFATLRSAFEQIELSLATLGQAVAERD